MEDMEIPVAVYVDGVLRRGSKKQVIECYKMITVSIPEVHADSAPVAAKIKNGFRSEYGPEGSQAEIRAFSGKLFKKTTASIYDSDTKKTTEEPVKSDMLLKFISGKDGDIYRNHVYSVLPTDAGWVGSVLFDNDVHREKPRLFKEDGWKSFNEKKVQEYLDKAKNLYENMIVIDGVFWQSIMEPVYVLNHSTFGFNSSSCTTAEVAAYGSKNVSSENLFNLNNWSDVVEAARDNYSAEIDEDIEVEIILPDVFRYDDLNIKVLDLLGKAVSEGADQLKNSSVEYLILWADFRDTLAEYRGDTEGGLDIEDVVVSAERYQASTEVSIRSSEYVKKASDIWENRRIVIDPVSPGASFGM